MTFGRSVENGKIVICDSSEDKLHDPFMQYFMLCLTYHISSLDSP